MHAKWIVATPSNVEYINNVFIHLNINNKGVGMHKDSSVQLCAWISGFTVLWGRISLHPFFTFLPVYGSIFYSSFEAHQQAALDHSRKSASWSRSDAALGTMLVAACLILGADGAAAETPPTSISAANLLQMTLEELANIEISSASEKTEHLSYAPASNYVIAQIKTNFMRN